MESRKAHSGWKWGCGGCAVFALALWSVGWVLIGQQLRRSQALEKMVAAQDDAITLARVPGGVARRVSPKALMMIQEVTWSQDSSYLLYAAAPEFSLGKIMRISSGSANPFDVQGNSERMQREMMTMMAPQLHFYDLRRGVAGQLQGTWAPNLHPLGRMRLSPDGRHLALVLADYGQISTVEEQFEAAGELYVVPIGPEMKLGQPVRLAAASQFDWLPDSKRLLYLQDAGEHSGTYLAEVRGGKPRLLNKEQVEYRLWGIARDLRTAYCTIGAKERNLIGQWWTLQHLDLRTGRFRQIPLRGGPTHLGPLAATESAFVQRPEKEGGPARVAAVDFATGHVRWLRDDLKGEFSGPHGLLAGQVVVMEGSETRAEAAKPTQFAFLSLRDGRVRLRPQPLLPHRHPDSWWASPDGRSMALQASSSQMTGLNPFSMLRQTLWVARIAEPDELLAGPSE